MGVHIPRGPGVNEVHALHAIVERLEQYAHAHSGAVVAVYRHSPYTVRVRVIDPGFQGMSKSERHRRVWQYLADLDEEVLNDLSTLILLTEAERNASLSNQEFDDPIPSRF